MSAHDCPLPPIGRKWLNRLYVCNCGKAWRIVQHTTWTGDYDKWERWKP